MTKNSVPGPLQFFCVLLFYLERTGVFLGLICFFLMSDILSQLTYSKAVVVCCQTDINKRPKYVAAV
ncbi:hypothetical protein CCP2SC5_1610001 [Azospirillaceae bacterium]